MLLLNAELRNPTRPRLASSSRHTASAPSRRASPHFNPTAFGPPSRSGLRLPGSPPTPPRLTSVPTACRPHFNPTTRGPPSSFRFLALPRAHLALPQSQRPAVRTSIQQPAAHLPAPAFRLCPEPTSPYLSPNGPPSALQSNSPRPTFLLPLSGSAPSPPRLTSVSTARRPHFNPTARGPPSCSRFPALPRAHLALLQSQRPAVRTSIQQPAAHLPAPAFRLCPEPTSPYYFPGFYLHNFKLVVVGAVQM